MYFESSSLPLILIKIYHGSLNCCYNLHITKTEFEKVEMAALDVEPFKSIDKRKSSPVCYNIGKLSPPLVFWFLVEKW